jgi:hypothetical protein
MISLKGQQCWCPAVEPWTCLSLACKYSVVWPFATNVYMHGHMCTFTQTQRHTQRYTKTHTHRHTHRHTDTHTAFSLPPQWFSIDSPTHLWQPHQMCIFLYTHNLILTASHTVSSPERPFSRASSFQLYCCFYCLSWLLRKQFFFFSVTILCQINTTLSVCNSTGSTPLAISGFSCGSFS